MTPNSPQVDESREKTQTAKKETAGKRRLKMNLGQKREDSKFRPAKDGSSQEREAPSVSKTTSSEDGVGWEEVMPRKMIHQYIHSKITPDCFPFPLLRKMISHNETISNNQ